MFSLSNVGEDLGSTVVYQVIDVMVVEHPRLSIWVSACTDIFPQKNTLTYEIVTSLSSSH